MTRKLTVDDVVITRTVYTDEELVELARGQGYCHDDGTEFTEREELLRAGRGCFESLNLYDFTAGSRYYGDVSLGWQQLRLHDRHPHGEALDYWDEDVPSTVEGIPAAVIACIEYNLAEAARDFAMVLAMRAVSGM